MNFDERMKLIDNIVDNEFNHVSNENLEGMVNLEEYNEIAKKNQKKYELLEKALPEDLRKVLWQYSDEHETMLFYEIQHYFKKGVVAGTSNLNFLRDITGGMKCY